MIKWRKRELREKVCKREIEGRGEIKWRRERERRERRDEIEKRENGGERM